MSQECTGHSGVKEPRVLWLGDEDHIVSTGFNVVSLLPTCLGFYHSSWLKGLFDWLWLSLMMLVRPFVHCSLLNMHRLPCLSLSTLWLLFLQADYWCCEFFLSLLRYPFFKLRVFLQKTRPFVCWLRLFCSVPRVVKESSSCGTHATWANQCNVACLDPRPGETDCVPPVEVNGKSSCQFVSVAFHTLFFQFTVNCLLPMFCYSSECFVNGLSVTHPGFYYSFTWCCNSCWFVILYCGGTFQWISWLYCPPCSLPFCQNCASLLWCWYWHPAVGWKGKICTVMQHSNALHYLAKARYLLERICTNIPVLALRYSVCVFLVVISSNPRCCWLLCLLSSLGRLHRKLPWVWQQECQAYGRLVLVSGTVTSLLCCCSSNLCNKTALIAWRCHPGTLNF